MFTARLLARLTARTLCLSLGIAAVLQTFVIAAEPVTLWDPAVPLPKRAAAPVLDDDAGAACERIVLFHRLRTPAR
jgi:hypothetical protein